MRNLYKDCFVICIYIKIYIFVFYSCYRDYGEIGVLYAKFILICTVNYGIVWLYYVIVVEILN